MYLGVIEFSKITTFLAEYLGIRDVWDIFKILIDIFVISYVFYLIFKLLRDSRAFQLIKGVILILIAAFIADLVELSTVSFLLKVVIEALPVMLIVLFQPELRRIFEGLGKKSFGEILSGPMGNAEETEIVINEIINASYAMGAEKTGALIIIEREISLSEIIKTGTTIDSNVSEQFLRLLFIKNTPLHDGAVVIKNNKITAAACYLPLSTNMYLNKALGTRHRAGIGISENSDCVSIIVSEETGYVSVAIDGKLKRDIKQPQLKKILVDALVVAENQDKKQRFLKKFERYSKTKAEAPKKEDPENDKT